MSIPIIDTFLYNGEPIISLRLKLLYPYVKEFVIIESWYTYSGDRKPFLYIDKNKEIFEPYIDKIKFIIINEIPPMPKEWLETTYLPSCMKQPIDWWRENYQRDIAANYIIEKYKDSKYILNCSDGDEIPNPKIFEETSRSILYYNASEEPLFLEMDFFYYNFKWVKQYKWYQAFIITDVNIDKNHLSYIRCNIPKNKGVRNAGWHCSYFLSKEDLKRKITSFAHQEFNQDKFKTNEHLQKCLDTGLDIFMRGDNENMIDYKEINKLPEGWQEMQKILDIIQSSQ